MVQVGSADQAELQERVRIRALRQCLARQLAQLHTGLQHDLYNGFERGFRSGHDLRRGKQPHAVDEADEVLLVDAQHKLVVSVSVQKQLRRALEEVGINPLSPGDLIGDPMLAFL